MNTITLHIGDVRDVMATMPASSVDLIVTSPPFLALRSYLSADHPDKHREIGSEATPAHYLDTMLELTQTWRRLLTPTGSLCVELGDTYSGGVGFDGTDQFSIDKGRGKMIMAGSGPMRQRSSSGWPLAKSLCGIPTLYAWSLAYGRNLLNPNHRFAPWRIRNLLTWTRPNPPVGALGDKFRPATSFVTVACTNAQRWFDLDAVRVPPSENTHARSAVSRFDLPSQQRDGNWSTLAQNNDANPAGAPPLDWWDEDDWQPLHNMPTHPYRGAHYATFNPQLPRRLIEAMCPRQVCVVCGEPRRRITGRTEEYAAARSQVVDLGVDRDPARRSVNIGSRAGHLGSITCAENVTLGWTDCGHYDPIRGTLYDPYRPGIVLDPFAGSGTTAIAATQTGRDSILTDIDTRTVDLLRQRLTETMRVIDETNDGTTWTWTVTPASKLEVDAIAAGQLTLFDVA